MGIVHVQPSAHQCSSSVAGYEGFSKKGLSQSVCISCQLSFQGSISIGRAFCTCVNINMRGWLNERKTRGDVREPAVAHHTPPRITVQRLHSSSSTERERERGNEGEETKGEEVNRG